MYSYIRKDMIWGVGVATMILGGEGGCNHEQTDLDRKGSRKFCIFHYLVLSQGSHIKVFICFKF